MNGARKIHFEWGNPDSKNTNIVYICLFKNVISWDFNEQSIISITTEAWHRVRDK